MRRRRLPEDRPARARDAVRGRARGRADRAAARRADRPLAHPVRRPADLRRDPESRDGRRLPDREPRADGLAAAHAAENAAGHHDPGRDRAARADPGRRREPLHRTAPAAARRPGLRGPLRAPVARRAAAGDARHDHLPGPGDRGRDGVRRLLGGGGGGAAARDEPQALGGGDRGAPRERSSRARSRRTGSIGELAERVFDKVRGFSGFGFPKAHGAAFGLLAYQSTWLRVHYAARVPVRAA